MRPDEDDALDRVVDETLRVHPLFGVAHRITSAPIVVDRRVTLPAGSVLLFNYLAFQRTGPAADDRFDPDRWLGRRHGGRALHPVRGDRQPGLPGPRLGAGDAARGHPRGAAPVRARLHRGAHPVAAQPRAGVPDPGRRRRAADRSGWPRCACADRWAEAGRSLRQLVLGTYMVVDARRQRLCATYFEEAPR